MWTYNYNNELYHFGIKGMKWGVRRYQNSDGSLTAAGKKRYGDKSPYEVKTADGDTFRIMSKTNPNLYRNSKKAKVTKTWGEHYKEIDDKKIAKQNIKAKKSSSKNNEKIFNALKEGAYDVLDKADRDNFFNSDSIFSEKSMKTQSKIDLARKALDNLDYKKLTSSNRGKYLTDLGKELANDYLDDSDTRSFFNDDWDTRMDKERKNDKIREFLK